MTSLRRNQWLKDGCTLLVFCMGLLVVRMGWSVFWLRSFTISDEFLIESMFLRNSHHFLIETPAWG